MSDGDDRRELVNALTARLSPTALSASRDALSELLGIMAALRTPVTGCPWDLEQTFKTIAPYTLEEAYEVVDAIERDDMGDLVDELGDLLLQVVFHARLAEEAGHFAFADVAKAISTKMLRRHPHVFGDEKARNAGMAKGAWNAAKAAEKQAKGKAESASDGVLSGVPVALPGLTRAVKLQDKAGRVGFDWNDPRAVIAKIREELDEVEAELDGAQQRRHDEIGDLFFALANLARHLQVDPEAAVRSTNEKFVRRFGFIEARLAEKGRVPQEATLEDMDKLWNEAKRAGL